MTSPRPVGLKEATAGDTLCDPQHLIALEKMIFPEPVIHVAVEPKTKADQEKMGLALQKLAKEDPSFRVHTDEGSGQTITSTGPCRPVAVPRADRHPLVDDFPSLTSPTPSWSSPMSCSSRHIRADGDDRALAPSGEVDRFFGQLELLLRDAGFLDGTNAERMMFSLRPIFGRARLEPRDVSILRGILTALSDRSRPEDA